MVNAVDTPLDGLANFDVVFAPSWNNPDAEIDAFHQFVRDGGGLITFGLRVGLAAAEPKPRHSRGFWREQIA